MTGTTLRRIAPAVAFGTCVLVASLVPIPGSGGGGDTGGGSGTGAGGSSGIGDGTFGVFGVFDVFDGLGVGLTDPFHLLGYAVLAALVTLAVGTDRRGLLLAAATATAFGFGVELLQLGVPWRTFAWRDVAVNAAGATLGALIAGVVARRPPAATTGEGGDDAEPSGGDPGQS